MVDNENFLAWVKERRVRERERLDALEKLVRIYNETLPFPLLEGVRTEYDEADERDTPYFEEIKHARSSLKQAISIENLGGPLKFDDVPPEIQEMILKCIIVQDEHIETFGAVSRPNLSILATSKWVNGIGRGIFYGHNKFCLDTSDMPKLRLLPLESIQHMVFVGHMNQTHLELLKDCKEFRSLKLLVDSIEDPDKVILPKKLQEIEVSFTVPIIKSRNRGLIEDCERLQCLLKGVMCEQKSSHADESSETN